MHRHHRSILYALLALMALFLAASLPAFAQGKPDLVWMGGGENAPVNSVAYSPDGKLIATGSAQSQWNGSQGTLKIWRAADGALLRTFFNPNQMLGFLSVAFSANGLLVAGGSTDGTVNLWSVADGSVVYTLSGFSGKVNSVAFSPDGNLLAAGSDDNSIRIWNVADGSLNHVITWHTTPVVSVAFSPDGQYFASLSVYSSPDIGQGLAMWRVSDWSQIYTYFYGGYSISFSPDGQKLAIPDSNAGVTLIQASNGSYLQSFPGNTRTAAFSPDGTLLAAQSSGTTINLWHVADGSLAGTLVGNNTYTVYSVAFSPDSQYLVAGSNDNTTRVWYVSDGTGQTLTQHTNGVWANAVSPDGKLLASGTANGDGIIIRRPEDGTVLHAIPLSTVQALAFSPDGQYLGAGVGNQVFLWKVNGWQPQPTLTLPASNPVSYQSVLSLCFSPNGQYLVAGWGGNTGGLSGSQYPAGVEVWHLPDFTAYALSGTDYTLNQHAYVSAAVSPDSKQIVAGSQDGIVKFWDAATGNVKNTLPAFPTAVNSVAFSPDGQTLAVGNSSYNGNPNDLSLWSVSTGGMLSSWVGDSAVGTISLAFSPDGQILASCGQSTIKFWLVSDPTNPSWLQTYDQETLLAMADNHAFAYSPDGKYVFYGRLDGTDCACLNPFRNDIFPNRGGNIGNITVTIITPDTFPVATGAQVKLTAPGTSDITGNSPIVSPPHTIKTTFDLTGAPLGARTLVITNSDGSTRSYPQGFTIEQGIEPQVVTDILGWSDLRAGPYETYTAVITNQGNVDANVADLRIEVPNWLNWQLIGTDPQNIFMGDDNTSFAVPVQTIPAYGSVNVPFQVQIADVSQNAHRLIQLLTWTDTSPKVDYIGDFSEPRIIRLEDASGTITDFLGTQDQTGAVTGLGAINVIDSNYTTIITTDAQYRPVNVQGSDGYGFTIGYISDPHIKITPYYPDGHTGSSFDINVRDATVHVPLLYVPATCDTTSRTQQVLEVIGVVATIAGIILAPEVDAAITADLGSLANGTKLVNVYKRLVYALTLAGIAADKIQKYFFSSKSSACVQGIVTGDPNDLEGPVGYGTAQWVPGAKPLPYTVFFSNDPNASAPAQTISVTDQLDPVNLDLTTVNLGVINIGIHQATPTVENSPPVGAKQYDYDLDLRPDNNIIAHIHASLDMLLGTLTYQFQSLDPSTGLPTTDPNAGLLPPGVEGTIQFSVVPKTSSPTGTVTSNQATIVFDYNPPMSTSVWSNTLDNDPPISHVKKLAASQKLGYFTVKWSGTDTINNVTGSGLANFTVYVSDNGGAYTPFLTNTTETSVVFTGVAGHTYSFYSIATDNAGNIQPTPATPDTTTKVPLALLSFVVSPTTVVGSQSTAGSITLDGPAPSDTVIKLTSSSSAVIVPATITVPAGSDSVSFGISTNAVTALTQGTIKASYNGGNLSQSIKVEPIGVQSVSISPNPVTGGSSATGTVTLEAAAAPGNITVSFTSSNMAVVSTPASITISAGSQTGIFTVNTSHVTKSTTVTLKTTANGVTKSVKLTVTP